MYVGSCFNMSRISAPLKESVLFSPRTANYVSSFIREGDKFDYYKWLQGVREEAAQAKELPQPITSENNVTARIDTPNSILLGRELISTQPETDRCQLHERQIV